jgi:hypothetical protein
MTGLVDAVVIGSYATAFGAVCSLVLFSTPYRALTVHIAKASTLAALGIILFAIVILAAAMAIPELGVHLFALPGASSEVTDRARALGEGISELINCSALALFAVAFGGVAWAFARCRMKGSVAATRR